jgi:hypothetical protein
MAACAAATNRVRRRRTSKAYEPSLAGQRDIRRFLFSEERASGCRGAWGDLQVIERKGNRLKRARDAKPRRRKALGEIRYNQIASYLVG